MNGEAVWAGVIVSDLAASAAWYVRELGCTLREDGDSWAALHTPSGGAVELFVGDRARPGRVFPSYGSDPGPPVLPGFAVEDPQALSESLAVVRRLPDWVVVVAPDGLRIVLTVADGSGNLHGFRLHSPDPQPQQGFFAALGIPVDVAQGQTPTATLLLAADRDEHITDPDGTPITLVTVP